MNSCKRLSRFLRRCPASLCRSPTFAVGALTKRSANANSALFFVCCEQLGKTGAYGFLGSSLHVIMVWQVPLRVRGLGSEPHPAILCLTVILCGVKTG